jgi:uncharacterized protein YijF (DUF1287 family)
MRTLAAAVLLAVTLPASAWPSGAAADPAGVDGPLPPLNRSILAGARVWLARGSAYDASYVAIPYPGGDVPGDRGACVDLVVRALRHAGLDLQRLIHEDRLARPGEYGAGPPPDPNLDHRRSANHVVYLRRHARSLSTRTDGAHLREWLPGDLVYYGTRRAWHAGIVSDRTSPRGMPYIIDSHQDAGGVSESFLLTRWGPILGHFRITGAPVDRGLQSGP